MRCHDVSDRTGIGELAHLDIGAAVAQHLDAFGAGARMARAIHHQIGAEAADDVAHRLDALFRRLDRSISTVASAPNFRASSSRGVSGAPTQITLPAPISCAAATARIPIGPEPWITTRVAPGESARARGAVEGADAGGQRLRQRAEPQRHVVGQFVDLGARQHLEIDIDIFGPAAPQMRRLVEAEIAAVIDRRQALVGALRIMDAVIATGRTASAAGSSPSIPP